MNPTRKQTQRRHVADDEDELGVSPNELLLSSFSANPGASLIASNPSPGADDITINSFFEAKPVTRSLDVLPATHTHLFSAHDTQLAPHAEVETKQVLTTLSATPSYVDKKFSFYSLLGHRETLVAVEQSLKMLSLQSGCNVECAMVYEDNTMNGKAFDCSTGRGCNFKVHFFSGGAKGVLCEFQRLRGCRSAFRVVYDRVFPLLKRNGVLCTSVPERRSRAPFAPLPLDPLLDGPAPQQACLDANSATSLLRMALSEKADVQRNAIQMLTQLSADAANQRVLCSEAVGALWLRVVSNLFELRNSDVLFQSCGAAFLANMCAQERTRAEIVEFHMEGLIGLLGTKAVPQFCRRELLRAVDALCSSHARRIREVVGLRRIVNVLAAQPRLCSDNDCHNFAAGAAQSLSQ